MNKKLFVLIVWLCFRRSSMSVRLCLVVLVYLRIYFALTHNIYCRFSICMFDCLTPILGMLALTDHIHYGISHIALF